ncbi:MAG: Hsp70 family protein [Proteobacteria bacterium]|nr:Hsp70 family protein [Pseudomonadota bacterium]
MNNIQLALPEMKNISSIDKPFRVIGIDLGTTNSSVAEIIFDNKNPSVLKPRCLEIEQETNTGIYVNVIVPSVVAILQNKIFVGEGAKRLCAKAPELGLLQNKNLFYECKNDMGILKTYHKAPEGFRSASEISSKILDFLYKSAISYSDIPIKKVVITVPASFQSAQRNDTVKAGSLAKIEITDGDLLDEPISAFLDYLFSSDEINPSDFKTPKNLLIFDFGGGTCDVAIFSVQFKSGYSPLEVSPLSVSRYHRLGGGDIDKAILYEILIPQLAEQNNISVKDFSYEDKKLYIEPQLLAIAESLKIGISNEISGLKGFNKYEKTDKKSIFYRLPGTYNCFVNNKNLTLKQPTINAEQFEEILEPFLDTDLLYARETEYRLTLSIFAPLVDAVDRAKLDKESIDYCLLVGGSSLIPQVVDAIGDYFKNAKILKYNSKEDTQLAVAKGAAYHALSLYLTGKSLIKQVCHDSIYLKTENGYVELIPKGAVLPFPAKDVKNKNYDTAIPETVIIGDLNLQLEICKGEEKENLFKAIWKIKGPVNRGEQLILEYSYNQNQILELDIIHEKSGIKYNCQIENPLTNVVNPNTERLKIAQIEEDLRTNKIPATPEKIRELADLYSEIGQKEKAIDFYKKVLQAKGKPNSEILNKIGILYGEIRDYEKEEKFYIEASKISGSWKGPIFNLALSYKNRKMYDKGIAILDPVLNQVDEGPYFVLRAMLAEGKDDEEGRKKYLEQSLKYFGPLTTLDDWELGWYLTAQNMLGNNKEYEKAKDEQKRRQNKQITYTTEEGILPIIKTGIKKV